MRMGGLWQEFLRLASAQSPRKTSPGFEGVPVQFVSQAVPAESAPCCAHEATSGGEENIFLLNKSITKILRKIFIFEEENL